MFFPLAEVRLSSAGKKSKVYQGFFATLIPFYKQEKSRVCVFNHRISEVVRIF